MYTYEQLNAMAPAEVERVRAQQLQRIAKNEAIRQASIRDVLVLQQVETLVDFRTPHKQMGQIGHDFPLFDFSSIDLRYIHSVEDVMLTPENEAVYFVHFVHTQNRGALMVYDSRKYDDDLRRLPQCPRETLVTAWRLWREQEERQS